MGGGTERAGGWPRASEFCGPMPAVKGELGHPLPKIAMEKKSDGDRAFPITTPGRGPDRG